MAMMLTEHRNTNTLTRAGLSLCMAQAAKPSSASHYPLLSAAPAIQGKEKLIKRGMNIQKDKCGGVLAGDGSLRGEKVRYPELLVYTWLESMDSLSSVPSHPPVFTFSLLPLFLLLWIICILLSRSHLFSPAVSFAPSDPECSVSSSKPCREQNLLNTHPGASLCLPTV